MQEPTAKWSDVSDTIPTNKPPLKSVVLLHVTQHVRGHVGKGGHFPTDQRNGNHDARGTRLNGIDLPCDATLQSNLPQAAPQLKVFPGFTLVVPLLRSPVMCRLL